MHWSPKMLTNEITSVELIRMKSVLYFKQLFHHDNCSGIAHRVCCKEIQSHLAYYKCTRAFRQVAHAIV